RGQRAVSLLALAQRRLGGLAFGDVVEDEGDAMLAGPADAKGVDVVPVAQPCCAQLEALRRAGQRHTPEGIEPGLLVLGRELVDAATDDVGESAVPLEGCIDL